MYLKRNSFQFSTTNIKPISWGYPPKGIALRLFLTCWLIYTLHFATNTVREIFPALSIGDHLSFRVDEYAGMHPDIFEKPGYGWHIGNNPGVSMLAAIPYFLSRPLIDPIVGWVNKSRAESGLTEPPVYNSPWPMAQEFYAEAWHRGYDVKFGLAAFVMQALCMAPVSALSAVFMFYLLRLIFRSDKTGLGLALLYALGTPVFFRTGTLNQNLMLGILAFFGFYTMWNPYDQGKIPEKVRYILGGLAGGAAILFDYSGIVFLLSLFIYGVVKAWRTGSFHGAVRLGGWYILGTLAPVALLWLYQWRSFGNPFLPGQHWMPPVQWIDQGYQGYGLPQLELFLLLGFDLHFGLFITSPLIFLGLAAPFLNRKKHQKMPSLELYTIFGLILALWIFFSGSNYVRLQFNTGLRYLTPILPFFFIPVAITLMRLPSILIAIIALASFFQSWALAMYREVESRWGMLDPILKTFLGGLQLPILRTISRFGGQFEDFFPGGVSPLPLFILTMGVIFFIWWPKLWRKTTQDG